LYVTTRGPVWHPMSALVRMAMPVSTAHYPSAAISDRTVSTVISIFTTYHKVASLKNEFLVLDATQQA
jgi:hypothetical protein